MLKMDERNFHCWNYRDWVVDLFLKEISKRVSASHTGEAALEAKQIWHKFQKPLVEAECKMAIGMVSKNFSNYSAWHFRSKLMPKFESYNGLRRNSSYLMALDEIKADFSTLKHAIFTDPKDQSPWNHHEWLLRQLTPI